MTYRPTLENIRFYGRRAFQPQDYEPALPLLWERLRGARGLAIKVAPGIDYRTLPWVDEVEIVSFSSCTGKRARR